MTYHQITDELWTLFAMSKLSFIVIKHLIFEAIGNGSLETSMKQ